MHHTGLWVHALGLNKFSGHAVCGVFDLFRSAAGDKPAARFTAAGAHIENVISAADDVEVVLNNNNGRAAFDERLEHGEQCLHVERVQADGRLVEHEHGAALCLAHLTRKL